MVIDGEAAFKAVSVYDVSLKLAAARRLAYRAIAAGAPALRAGLWKEDSSDHASALVRESVATFKTRNRGKKRYSGDRSSLLWFPAQYGVPGPG